jgi:hypothetical protein
VLVTYGRVPELEPLVPTTMSEVYRDGATEIRAEARYSRVRRFATAVRLVPPE